MNPLANLNGKIMPLDEVTISPLDRGFLFGDAVYEVLRVYQSKPWLEDEHFERFERSLGEIRITGVDMPRLRRRMHETIKAGGFTEAMVYLQVTRGAAPRKHAFPQDVVPLDQVELRPEGLRGHAGSIGVVACATQRRSKHCGSDLGASTRRRTAPHAHPRCS